MSRQSMLGQKQKQDNNKTTPNLSKYHWVCLEVTGTGPALECGLHIEYDLIGETTSSLSIGDSFLARYGKSCPDPPSQCWDSTWLDLFTLVWCHHLCEFIGALVLLFPGGIVSLVPSLLSGSYNLCTFSSQRVFWAVRGGVWQRHPIQDWVF